MNIQQLHARYLHNPELLLADTNDALALAGSVNARSVFTEPTAALALLQAQAASKRFASGKPLGLLDGIRLVWKDLFDQQGLRTLAASKTRLTVDPASQDAVIVAQLKAAGTVSLGRTNLSEFAFSGVGINPGFGTPASVLSTAYPAVPGGSSSGSAVAVGLGIATIGMGTDTSGSVRIPAALNGLYGFRPTTDRYSRQGVFPLSVTLDSVGSIAHSFEDIALLDRMLMPASMPFPGPVGNRDRVILDISQSLGITWSDSVYAGYCQALRTYEAKGFSIRQASLKSVRQTQKLFASHGTLVAIEARRLHQDLLNSEAAALMDPFVHQRLAASPVVTEPEYQAYLGDRQRLVRLAAAEVDGALIACPTVPSLHHELADFTASMQRFNALNSQLLAATMLGSFLDFPGVAVPVFESGEVCCSVLLSAASGTDESLLLRLPELL